MCIRDRQYVSADPSKSISKPANGSIIHIPTIAKEIAIMKETKKSIKKNILLPLQDNELFGLIINSLKSPSVY